jgi:hypothetical protein
MFAHGEYTIEVKDQVVHTYPSGAFNQEGLEKIHSSILENRPEHENWGLYEHPDDSSGLTPEAIEELLHFYQSLESEQCQFICMQMSMLASKMFEVMIDQKVTIPVYINPSEQTLANLTQQLRLS